MPYGAICQLLEYGNSEAFLHISEVAPRWIKNIHEFISEGQRVVAKVHRIDKEKCQIDVSLKRVNEEEKRRKLEQVNFSNRAKKLIEVALQKVKGKKSTPEEIIKMMEEKYGDAYSCLKEVAEKGKQVLEELGLPKPLIAPLTEVAEKNIKKQVIKVDAIIRFSCFGGEGTGVVKEGIINAIKNKKCTAHYLGAPRYKLSLVGDDYKTAEKEMDEVIDIISDYAKKNYCNFEVEGKTK